ncbi:RNA-binding region-containing protein 3 [Galendromus occidentalis]|uniref:RNA-binding region-containing protein 3 n=1 Tax=Galendromus occidentalis TaxID=34638 RepID=A0AAJ6QS56_9ACAR|nr:RNA-binding region-containing protein 3 [Galendromus occidentalis]
MSSSHPINRRILQVRHLPRAFTETQSTALLKGHGAHTVTFQRKSVFAFFDSEASARQAMQALHQLHLNESVLLVTFARANYPSLPLLPPVLGQQQVPSEEGMIRKLHAIAPHLNFNYILNPMVKYKYPPINDTILANICEALRDNSNFYTQVLHLMNKMCIPPPFRRKAVPSRVFQRSSRDTYTQITSDSESDLSDAENVPRRAKRRARVGTAALEMKPIRKPKTDIPIGKLLPESSPMDVSLCFESPQIRRLEIVPIHSVGHGHAELDPAPGEGFGRIDPPQPEEGTPEILPKFDFVSAEFRDVGTMERLSIKDSIDHAAFRNYEEGDVCVRLYLKNLHKSTTEEELFSVFGQFVPDNDAERAIFDIKLMKSGRMRGQAFVTYGSVPAAERALELTNRVILNGKPMSVQFAKAARVES